MIEEYIIPKLRLEPGYKLYRYDLCAPPTEWCSDFHNPEYGNSKNQAGLFFFFNSQSQAINTGYSACNRYKDRNYSQFWITQTELTAPVLLLDLRKYIAITGLLAAFYASDIDIFSLTVSGSVDDSNKLSLFKDQICEFVAIVEDKNWYLDAKKNEKVNSFILKIEKFYVDYEFVGLFGQRLTDFHNGLIFKQILQQKGYDGYIFNESNNAQGSDTICLLSSVQLSSPSVWNL
ncbi:hypothetical protein [Phocaeicola vulgatus]|uniref:hypothetical protein n=1 Tax=Phocaeicola vulgatus TaxID=821 RepID=UPI001E444F56|nr:hypothetical protein [Phocaeicola vulgatus]BDC06858.1 hypothetical protein GAIMETA21S03_27410 [Phocaeicola vulgatus]